MTTEDYQSNLDELIKHNGHLVRTAQALQAQVQAAVRVCGQVVDCAEPFGECRDGIVGEYLVPADLVEELRAVCVLYRTWGVAEL